MTKEDIKLALDLMSDYWGVKPDDSKIASWHRVLKDLKITGVLLAIDSFVTDPDDSDSSKFAPKLPQIIERYEKLKLQQEKKLREDEQENQFQNQTHQEYCPLCEGSGDVFHWKNGYQFHYRCICSYGRNFVKWGREGIVMNSSWTNPKTGRNEALYYPRVDDVLTPEEIGIIKARNMARRDKYKGKEQAIREIKRALAEMGV